MTGRHVLMSASRVLPQARDIRCTGSSALDLCWAAAGRFDAFYEDELEGVEDALVVAGNQRVDPLPGDAVATGYFCFARPLVNDSESDDLGLRHGP